MRIELDKEYRARSLARVEIKNKVTLGDTLGYIGYFYNGEVLRSGLQVWGEDGISYTDKRYDIIGPWNKGRMTKEQWLNCGGSLKQFDDYSADGNTILVPASGRLQVEKSTMRRCCRCGVVDKDVVNLGVGGICHRNPLCCINALKTENHHLRVACEAVLYWATSSGCVSTFAEGVIPLLTAALEKEGT